jgi:hypothetical protein
MNEEGKNLINKIRCIRIKTSDAKITRLQKLKLFSFKVDTPIDKNTEEINVSIETEYLGKLILFINLKYQ